MKRYMIDLPMRLFLLFVTIILWLGIWLTGFESVHWVLYLPPVFFSFAVITGICPGLIFTKMACKV